MSSAHEPVVGTNSAGGAQAGTVWLSSTLTAGGLSQPVVAINEAYPPSGIALYTQRWGSARIPDRSGGVSRAVVNHAMSSPQRSRGAMTVPSGGSLLVAHGQAASNWLSSLPAGAKVSVSSAVKSSAAKRFVQAYGVGTTLVATPGVVRSGFTCDSANTTQPARTAIGFADGGRALILAVVSDHPFTSQHGLDEDQMSKLMVQLGASQAYAFDGSGSSELLARLHRSSPLTLQTYPGDGQERPMPVGLGVTSVPVKTKKHKPK
jgi:hypothetical protein